jgi:hypothetical protein
MLKLNSKIQRAEVVHTGPELGRQVSDEWDSTVSDRRDAAAASR